MFRNLAILLALAFPLFTQAAIFTVDDAGNASDFTQGDGICATFAGVCTLRAALNEANALAGTDTIHFAIGSGPQTIAVLGSPLPISSSVLIDATTQPGTGAGPFILVDGNDVGQHGFEFSTAGGLSVELRGLAITRFAGAGIKAYLTGSTLTVKDCHIGVGLDGVTAMGNGGDGIWVTVNGFSGSSIILGDTAGGGNVISGNAGMALEIEDSPTGAKLTELRMQGNIIGLGSDGMTAIPNGGGVRTDLQFGTVNIGGSIAARNIISGNLGWGYGTSGFLQADVLNVSHNYIGVAQDGITPRGNGSEGLILVGKQYNVRSNIIGANGSNGISFSTNSTPSSIQGNRIGVAADGSPAGNGGNGIIWRFQSGGRIGGAAPGEANLIAHNAGAGIRVLDGQVEIDANSIHSNGSLGIDIGTGNVVDANDAGDADSGSGNNLQNRAELTSAVRSGGITFIGGSLAAAASTTYTLRFFSSTAADPSGYGEGETFLGATTVTTGAGGSASFTYNTPGAAAGTYVTATATNNATGDTSEFSNATLVAAPPQFRFASATYAAGESGNVTITVERIGGTAGAASVQWAAQQGSATSADFTAGGATLNFASGEATRTISIPITADTLDELSETFTVVLSNPSAGIELGAPATTTVTIADDDPEPAISIADNGVSEGDTGNMALPFQVTLSTASGKTVTVDYATANGTATAGADYAAAAGTITFDPGQTSRTIVVQVVGDTATELAETFHVTLANANDGQIGDGTAVGTIDDDDGAPGITVSDVAVIEGDGGTSSALFTLVLSGPAPAPVTVNWSTSAGTATAGGDYESANGIATFAPGATTATVAVTILGDALVEDNETFFLDLSGPANATLADAQGGGTIADDDGTPALSINDPATVEGVASSFTVTLAPASALPVTVTYATGDLTANGGDYGGATDTLTFAPGETSKTIPIAVFNDAVAEATEQFRMTLSAPGGATIGDALGLGTIIDDDGPPRVTVGNASSAETNAGTTPFTFDVDLSHASAATVTVGYTVGDGTATSGDYTAASGTLTFLPGVTSQTIDVPVAGDTLVEPDETFVVTLAGATSATIVDGEAIGTIVNDDGGAEVSIANVAENEDAGSFTFDVTLSAPTSQTVSVTWASADVTANAGSDYDAGAGTVTFAPGDTEETIAIFVHPDTAFEPDESFAVNLLAATNATLGDAQATGTILNDEATPVVPSISIAGVSHAEGNAGSTLLTVQVTLDAATVNTVTVAYATSNGSALAGADYVAASGTLTFPPVTTTRTIAIPVIGDALVEGNETFTITLSAPANATLGTGIATATILDDDVAPAVPSITIADANAVEGHAGSTALVATVQLSTPTTATVTVDYATTDASAIAGSDYAATNGTLTFAPGETAHTISIPVIGDTTVEGNETFTVTLSAPANATLGTGIATATILDDDVAPAVPSINIAGANAVEGHAGSTALVATVQLSTPTTATVTVDYATTDASAVAGSDYAATNGTLTFAPGETAHTISIPVIGDTTVEGNETFTVTLSAPANATLGTGIATATILDDDVAPAVPSIFITGANAVERNAGSTALVATVQLSTPTTATVTVDYATTDASAVAGSDYAATNGTLTFAPGETAHTITIPVIGDTTVEGNETFTVTLSAPANATLGTGIATATILDDDVAPAVPSIAIGNVDRDEGDSGASVFPFPVTLSSPATAVVTVAWSTSSGSANASDFVPAGGTLVFAPGMTAQTIAVAVHGDTDFESDETFTIHLSAAANATIAGATATGTVRNDDRRAPATPSLQAPPVTVAESAGEAVIALTLSARASAGASVRWMTRGGTASGGADFTESSGRATFGSNTTATIAVPITADAAHEPEESFVLELFDADGLSLAADRVTVTITDDDPASAADRAIVLAVGSLHGNAGSRFGTAVQIVNPSDVPASGTLLIHPAATSETARDVSIPYSLAPRELRAWSDLLAENGLEGLATLDVIPATGPLPHLTVRIYDDAGGHGTTGFTLPVVTPADALPAGATALLIAPADPIAMRYNIGIRTLGAGASMTIAVRTQSGATRHTTARDFPANWFHQFPAGAFTGVPLQAGDYIAVTVTKGSAILYGASVDNLTNDPSVEIAMR